MQLNRKDMLLGNKLTESEFRSFLYTYKMHTNEFRQILRLFLEIFECF